MATKKTFLTYIQQKYREFIAKKLASQNEIIAFLAQIAKYHYLKTSIEKKSIHDIKNIDTIRNDEKLQEFFKKYKNMFDSFYQNQQEEIALGDNLYKKTIDWLIEEWNNIDPTNTNKSTNSNLVKIIQAVAKKLSNGPYIDLAVGTGRLLENFKLNQTKVDGAAVPIGNSVLKTKTSVDLYNYGFDIDDNALYLADALLNYRDKNPYVKLNFGGYKFNNSIRNVYQSLKFKEWEKEYPVFMFDPPLGTKSIQARPAEWKNINDYREIFGNAENSDSTTDILFLANYLFNAHKKSYFIGIFPESILNNNTKEYPNLRKYLIQKNLNYVISYDRPDSSRLVILAGTKDKTKLNKNILSIKIFNQQGINNLSTEIDKKNSDDNVAITEAPRNSFSFPYNIQLPSKIKFTATVVKQLSSKELAKEIFQKEKDLFRYSYRIRKFINENIENEIKQEEQPKDKEPWFKNSENSIAKDLVFFTNYSTFNQELSIGYINNLTSNDYTNIKNYFTSLRNLYNNSRLDVEHESINFAEGIKENNNEKREDFIEKLTKYKWIYTIPPFLKNKMYKDIYKAYCKYWLLNQKEEITGIMNQYSKSEISSGVKLLYNIGILKKLPFEQILKNDLYIYNLYRPSFKFFDGGIL